MKRKPLTKGEWALVILPLLVLAAFSWMPLSSLHDEWIIRKNRGHISWNNVAWSPDSQYFASGGGVVIRPPAKGGTASTAAVFSRGDLAIYDKSGTCIRRLTAQSSPLSRVEFSPDGHSILTVAESDLRVWDTASGEQRLHIQSTYLFAKWSKDSKTIEGWSYTATRTRSGRLRMPVVPSHFKADIATGVTVPTVTVTRSQTPTRATQSGSGFSAVKVAGRINTWPIAVARPSTPTVITDEIEIRDPSSRKIVTLSGYTEGDMAWSGDRTFVNLSPLQSQYGTVGMMLTTVNVHTKTQKSVLLDLAPFAKPTPTPTRPPGQLYSYAYYGFDPDLPQNGNLSKDGKRAAVWSDKTLWLIDVASAEVIASWPVSGFSPYKSSCQFSPDSRSLAWANDDEVHVVDATTGK